MDQVGKTHIELLEPFNNFAAAQRIANRNDDMNTLCFTKPIEVTQTRIAMDQTVIESNGIIKETTKIPGWKQRIDVLDHLMCRSAKTPGTKNDQIVHAQPPNPQDEPSKSTARNTGSGVCQTLIKLV